MSQSSTGGHGGDKPEGLDLPTENKREVQSTDKDMHVNGSGSSQNSQVSTSNTCKVLNLCVIFMLTDYYPNKLLITLISTLSLEIRL